MVIDKPTYSYEAEFKAGSDGKVERGTQQVAYSFPAMTNVPLCASASIRNIQRKVDLQFFRVMLYPQWKVQVHLLPFIVAVGFLKSESLWGSRNEESPERNTQ